MREAQIYIKKLGGAGCCFSTGGEGYLPPRGCKNITGPILCVHPTEKITVECD